MDIKQFLNSGIIEKYVLGLASPEEMDYVEQMTRDYPEVNAHICKMQNCMSEYAEQDCTRSLKNLKNKIISMSGRSSMGANREVVHHLPNAWKWGAGIAVVMIFTFGNLSWMFYNNEKAALNEIAELSSRMNQLRSEQNALQVSDNQIREKYTVLKDVNTKEIHLKGSEDNSMTHAVIYLNAEQDKCFLNIIGLPKCPYGNEYQMWAKVDGKHIDLGVLETDAKEKDLFSIPFVKNCNGFVITLEKKGGSPSPTVENMYAYGGM
jgi:anti-sigma-K factor RskA